MFTTYEQVDNPREIMSENTRMMYQSLHNMGVDSLSESAEEGIEAYVKTNYKDIPQPLQRWITATATNLVDDLIQATGDAFQVALYNIGMSIMSLRLAVSTTSKGTKDAPACSKGFKGLFCRLKATAKGKADIIYETYCHISDNMIASHNESRSPRAIREMKLFEMKADEIEMNQARDRFDREQKILMTGILTGSATDVQIKKFLKHNLGLTPVTDEQVQEYRTALSFVIAKGKNAHGKTKSFGMAELMLALMQSRGARF